MPRLLVVEDFPPLAKGLVRALRQAGHGVQMAATRAEARHVEGWFDAAIVDLELPDGSGIDVASDLRTSGRVDQIIFFTACHDSGLLAKAAEIGRVVDKAAGVAMLIAGLELWLVRAEERRVAVGDPTRDSATQTPSQRSGTRRIR
jgi:DNA-binding response OmpR family regulator